MGKTGIGKPQKSRKHKKLKPVDPAYSALYDKRKPKKPHQAVIRGKKQPNARPTEESEKDMTLSVRRFNQMKKDAKSFKNQPHKKRQLENMGNKEGWNKRSQQMERGMTRPLKPSPVFKQEKWETELAFHNRMDREAQSVIARQQYEDEYNIDMDILESGKPVVKKEKTSQKTKVRTQKKMAKEKEKKAAKHEERTTGFEHLKDDISFGEVAMQPPTLTHKPRKAEQATKKPGTKSLLLTEIMRSNSSQKTTGSSKRQIGKTLKRKLMSPAQQVRMDDERQKAIDEYRKLKLQKMSKQNT